MEYTTCATRLIALKLLTTTPRCHITHSNECVHSLDVRGLCVGSGLVKFFGDFIWVTSVGDFTPKPWVT